MPIVSAADVGPKYDILISTRDGSTLSCRDGRGINQNLSQVAYVCSTEEKQEESTDLNRQQALTKFASAQITDIYFDAWPQVEQGNWQDGQGQRVFSGQGEALGTVANKSTAYWDGRGILWPLDDYVPQQPLLPLADQAEGGAIMQFAGNGVTAGDVLGSSSHAKCFVYAYMQNSAPQHNILCIQLNNGVLRKLNPMPGSVNGTPFVSCDYVIGQGSLFYAYDSGGNVIQTATISSDSPPVASNMFTITNAVMNVGNSVGRIATGIVAGRTYFAIAYHNVLAPFEQVMQIFDLTAGLTGGSATGQIVLGPSGLRLSVLQLEFQGDNVVIGAASGFAFQGGNSWSAGSEAAIFEYNIPSSTISTLANFPGYNNVSFCPIAGGLFILATIEAASDNFPNSVDMYLLMGGSLQYIGPVRVQASSQAQSNTITGVSEPQAMGPYAVFPVYYFPPGSATTQISVFAYDVLRGRLFKLNDFGGYDQFLGNNHGRRCGVYATMMRSFGSGTVAVQRGVVIPTVSSSGSAHDVSNAQELLIGVSNGTFQPFLQQGVQITSSLIDFTSAQNKLYRQLVASFTALPSDAGITVQLDAWFDQDPGNLNASPDFTTGVVAAGVNGGVLGQTQLKLPTNKIARKVVYRITTVGPSATLTAAVKLISVAIQVATGWSWHMFLLCSNTARSNNDDLCFERQVAGVDEVSAYNFIRQLWRTRGGECAVTLPNGDSYDAILQFVRPASPKPFGSSYNAAPSYQNIVEIQFREDV